VDRYFICQRYVAGVFDGTVFSIDAKTICMKSYLLLFLAGVVTGMLIAPEKGTETRRKLRRYYTDAQEGLNKLKNKATDKVEQVAGDIDSRIQASV
jgi:hypothetical protein